jgi:hypothetical protein
MPTGAKTGVMRSPCGVEKIPVRARLFWEVILYWNLGGIIQDEIAVHALLEADSVSITFASSPPCQLTVELKFKKSYTASMEKP